MSARLLRFTRVGGFANVRLTTEVDDPDQAETIYDAAQRSAEQPADGRTRDGFVYEFTFVTETRTETVDLAASQVSDDLRPWVRELIDRARPARE